MFSKENLESGNVIETRMGGRYLYHHQNRDKLLNLKESGFLHLNDFDENLKECGYDNNEFDIMKVYADYTCKELIWERKEIKLSETERAILNAIDENYNWICRDKDNRLVISRYRPSKVEHYNRWYATTDRDGDITRLPFTDLFKSIQWDDDEPYSIDDLLKESEE